MPCDYTMPHGISCAGCRQRQREWSLAIDTRIAKEIAAREQERTKVRTERSGFDTYIRELKYAKERVPSLFQSNEPLKAPTEDTPTPTRDPWANRSKSMRCATCMFYVEKEGAGFVKRSLQNATIGRCRRHAPTMNGYPVVFEKDWCGDHKLDETKS